MKESFKTYCTDKKPHCGEPADESKSKVCYWCYRAYHHATRHARWKINDFTDKLKQEIDSQDNI